MFACQAAGLVQLKLPTLLMSQRRSELVRKLAEFTLLGMRASVMAPNAMVGAPSAMNSHCQPRCREVGCVRCGCTTVHKGVCQWKALARVWSRARQE